MHATCKHLYVVRQALRDAVLVYEYFLLHGSFLFFFCIPIRLWYRVHCTNNTVS